MTWDGHKECTLKTLAEDEWVKMHSELLTNGVKHTHTHRGHTLRMQSEDGWHSEDAPWAEL